MSLTLDQISKLPQAMQAQVMADQARANAARERIMAQFEICCPLCGKPKKLIGPRCECDEASLPTPPAKSPRKRVSVAKQAIPTQAESRMQQEVIRWFRDNCYEWQLEEELLMAFPLQGHRSPKNGARMKSEGMRRGTPDMLLAVPRGDRCGLWIEMKTAKGYLNPFQKLMLARLAKAGAATVVCRSPQEAQHAIRAYLNLPTPGETPIKT